MHSSFSFAMSPEAFGTSTPAPPLSDEHNILKRTETTCAFQMYMKPDFEDVECK